MLNKVMEFVIITGLSGAGKSQAVNILEDLGFYCVDNIPPRLLVTFADMCAKMQDTVPTIAIVVDARGKEMFKEFMGVLEELDEKNYQYKILFLDCEEHEIINRYKQTRRRHPLLGDDCSTLEQAITAERNILHQAKQHADYVIDSTLLSTSQLKEQIYSLFENENSSKFIVTCMSFGFKYGIPADADLVFDVRCLPNPFYIPELRPLSGLDKRVQDYILECPQSQGLMERLKDLIDYLLSLYRDDEKRSRLVIAMGCTGGRHRSVTFAEMIAKYLRQQDLPVSINHRDIDRVKHG